jgi:uncharacterized protein (TIGR03084 family)
MLDCRLDLGGRCFGSFASKPRALHAFAELVHVDGETEPVSGRLFWHACESTFAIDVDAGARSSCRAKPHTYSWPMTEIFDDLEAEQEQIEAILAGLADDAWLTESGAPGWTIADVVLHLAQTEEAVIATVAGARRAGDWHEFGESVDAAMANLVDADDSTPQKSFERWRSARRSALAALRKADPQTPLFWVATSLKPRTLATTRLAEHWAHALDIVAPLGIEYPYTVRLRHIAWLGHSTLPYAFSLMGQEPVEVYCELTGPDGGTWCFGPADAASAIKGDAGAFCRVGAQRLAPEESGLLTMGPHGMRALRALRNYAQ